MKFYYCDSSHFGEEGIVGRRRKKIPLADANATGVQDPAGPNDDFLP
jgi:hypothetical protein